MIKRAEETIPRNLQQAVESVINLAEVGIAVEIGFGNGALSKWIAKRLSGRGKVIAFDANPVLVRRAKSESKGRGISNVLFESGDANELPLPDEYTDLLICKHLLCALSKPGDAIREMMRVTKRGGHIVAIEPGTSQEFYDPGDEEFAELSTDLNRAFVEGWGKRGADQRIGLRVPNLFLESGLTEVTSDGVVEVHLLSDGRRTDEDIKDQLATEATELDADTKKMLVRGGMSATSLRRFHELASQRLAKYGDSIASARKSGYQRIMSVDIVVAARKK
jgi:ubiquinone/menaquinone biosynthesis C-methylase UbiE